MSELAAQKLLMTVVAREREHQEMTASAVNFLGETPASEMRRTRAEAETEVRNRVCCHASMLHSRRNN